MVTPHISSGGNSASSRAPQRASSNINVALGVAKNGGIGGARKTLTAASAGHRHQTHRAARHKRHRGGGVASVPVSEHRVAHLRGTCDRGGSIVSVAAARDDDISRRGEHSAAAKIAASAACGCNAVSAP